MAIPVERLDEGVCGGVSDKLRGRSDSVVTKVTDTAGSDDEPFGEGAPDPLWLAGAECAFLMEGFC